MKLQITWLEAKTLQNGSKLLDAQFIGEDGQQFDATIWEKDNKGVAFPNFAELKAGQTIEGNPWKSPTSGKISIYPPRVDQPKGGAGRTAQINQSMEKKGAMIKDAQENKELGIKLSSTMGNAVNIALQEAKDFPFSEKVYQERVKYWRKWLFDNWGENAEDITTPF